MLFIVVKYLKYTLIFIGFERERQQVQNTYDQNEIMFEVNLGKSMFEPVARCMFTICTRYLQGTTHVYNVFTDTYISIYKVSLTLQSRNCCFFVQ